MRFYVGDGFDFETEVIDEGGYFRVLQYRLYRMYRLYREVSTVGDEPVGDVGAGISFVFRGRSLQIVGDQDGEPGALFELLCPFLIGIDIREGYDAAAVE